MPEKIVIFFATCVVSLIYWTKYTEASSSETEAIKFNKSHLLLQKESGNDSPVQCIPSGIHAFPEDFLTQEQRLKGGLLVHIFLFFYACAALGIVCHDYFVPSLSIISERMKLPPDIAGATFMAIGTSAPEFFSSVLGSFVTEGDIGVGTIIGSAVFNIVGVTGLVGVILWKDVLNIEWYPIARDCTVYGVTILTLIWIISDNIVHWWEALILLMVFFLYIVIIYHNKRMQSWCLNQVYSGSMSRCCLFCPPEKTPLITAKVLPTEIVESFRNDKKRQDSFSVEITASREKHVLQLPREESIIEEIIHSGEELSNGSLCQSPATGGWRLLWWILLYPIRLVLFITIPDNRRPRMAHLFPLTFAMSVLWIGVLSYLAVWMVTVAGFTLAVPDSVSGLTILAAGTSVPEIISSVIVAKKGFGNMAISNLVGSNTFDISFCLGLPWLLKTLTSKTNLIVYSSALTYTTATLLVTLVAFVLVLVFSGWKLNRTVGLVYFAIYGIFVGLSCMYELNVFGEINMKPCE